MSQKKKKTDNLSNYDKAPDHVIQFYIYCTTWASKAKYRLTQLTGIEILPPKQRL